MRDDFDKLLVERPRWGSRDRRKKRRYNRAQIEREPDVIPSFESASRNRGGTRHLSENFAPLLRFLRMRAGRPWNVVRAELSEHVRLDNAVQRHVLVHLRDIVLEHVEVFGRNEVGRIDRGGPEYSYGDNRFYVCPRTGLLRILPRRPPRTKAAPAFFPADDGRQYWNLQGVWYLVTLAELPAAGAFDVVLRRVVRGGYPEGNELAKTYGRRGVYAAARTQLDSRAIRRAGLSNDARTRCRTPALG